MEERLLAGGLSILAGKPKSGKSTLARCLALAVARGEPWLGFPTRQGSVFYLAHEEKRAEVRKHFRAMGATEDDGVFVFLAPSPEDGLRKLRGSAERWRPALIIIDPLLKFVRVNDANDYAALSNALEPILTLARETGTHLLTLHHTGEADRTGGDAILGSTAIFAAPDTALFLKRTERYRTLSTIQRYGEDLEEVTLFLDPDTKTVTTAGTSRKDADQAEAERAILEYLNGQVESLEEPPILEAVEGRRAAKVRALRDLVERGKITRTGGGKRNDPYRYAISRILVPDILSEPENKKSNSSVTTNEQSKDSRSREKALFGEVAESRERESETPAEVDL